jgi:hypothetical protein
MVHGVVEQSREDKKGEKGKMYISACDEREEEGGKANT